MYSWTLIRIILISLVLCLSFCSCATIRELISSKSPSNKTNYSPWKLDIKVERGDVWLDHLEVESKKIPSTEFLIPLQNKRGVTVYTLAELKAKNLTRYDLMKNIMTERIMNRQLMSNANKQKELDLLNKYDLVMSCKWENPLPAPFDDDQCNEEELNAEIKAHTKKLIEDDVIQQIFNSLRRMFMSNDQDEDNQEIPADDDDE